MRLLKVIIYLSGFFISVMLHAQTFNKIIVFGDSLSDNGNLYKLTQGRAPKAPYFHGRYSNGLVWPEILANNLITPSVPLEDYAIAGAQTHGIKPPGLIVQVKKYLNTHQVDPNALYIIWSGSDNYINHPQANLVAIDQAITNIAQAITLLTNHGAKLFLVFNLPDIGVTPLAKHWNKKYPHLSTAQHLTWLTETHNKKLTIELLQLNQNKNVKIISIDVYDLLKQAMRNPEKYGINNTTDRCYIGSFKGGGKVCAQPNKYLFWDWVHPTTQVHRLIAESTYQTLWKAKIYPN